MHIWLTSIPLFGDAIIDWEKNRVIKPKAKALALTMIWLTMGYSIIFSNLRYELKLMLFAIAISISVFILTRNSYPKE